MFKREAQANILRTRNAHEHGRVTNVELFFDLVFVFAVTQLSHSLIEDLSLAGALHTLLLLLAVWWAWVDTSWVTNWLNREHDRRNFRNFQRITAWHALIVVATWETISLRPAKVSESAVE